MIYFREKKINGIEWAQLVWIIQNVLLTRSLNYQHIKNEISSYADCVVYRIISCHRNDLNEDSLLWVEDMKWRDHFK